MCIQSGLHLATKSHDKHESDSKHIGKLIVRCGVIQYSNGNISGTVIQHDFQYESMLIN